MSKIEDDTTRSGSGRSDAPASISDQDGGDDPVVVPANDDWSVDDDDRPSTNGRHRSNGSTPAEEATESTREAERANKRTAPVRRVTRLRPDDNPVAESETVENSVADTQQVEVEGREVTGLVPIVITEQTEVEPLIRDQRTIDRDSVDHAFDDRWTGGAWTDAPLHNEGTPAGIPLPSTQAPISRRRRVRRVNRILRHVDPWSVFKVGLLFSLIGYLVFMTSGVLLWDVASRTGTLPNIEGWLTRYGWETFSLDGAAIFKNAAVAGLFAAVGATGAMVMFATVFNLVSDAIGGIRISVLEEEVIAVDSDDNPGMGTMISPTQHHATDNWAIEDF